jgi:hypothetical protein
MIQPLVVNSILFYFQLKVDRQMSRGSRDKCPVKLLILIKYPPRVVNEHRRPPKEVISHRSR